MNVCFLNFLVRADAVCDCIPFVSSVNNLIDLFQKTVFIPFTSDRKIASNHYYAHLKEKSFIRCSILLIPILGNAFFMIYDFLNDPVVPSKQMSNPIRQDGLRLDSREDDTTSVDESIVSNGALNNGSTPPAVSIPLDRKKETILSSEGSIQDDLSDGFTAEPGSEHLSEADVDLGEERPLFQESISSTDTEDFLQESDFSVAQEEENTGYQADSETDVKSDANLIFKIRKTCKNAYKVIKTVEPITASKRNSISEYTSSQDILGAVSKHGITVLQYVKKEILEEAGFVDKALVLNEERLKQIASEKIGRFKGLLEEGIDSLNEKCVEFEIDALQYVREGISEALSFVEKYRS